MKQALLKKGIIYPCDVPESLVKNGFVRIKVLYSCISAGTEISGVVESKKGIIRKALENPMKIRAALAYLKDQGYKKTKEKLSLISDGYKESGYSISGKVVEIGDGVEGFQVGDLVAAGGMRFAVHAEYVVVPKNLVVKTPNGLSALYASTSTVGSIALHGVRRADLKIGEYGVVLGAGLLGLLSLQILKSSGVRVACIDLNDSRLGYAKEMGAELVINPANEDSVELIRSWTSGYGADAVLFTASTSSSDPLSKAFQMTRKKGRVVLVGVSGMTLQRNDIYSDEIDFLISTSYGPGRYDDNYELKGWDYPYHYVRWTENRNMAEFMRLILDGSINYQFLNPKVYPFSQISQAFNDLELYPDNHIISIISYDEQSDVTSNEDIETERNIDKITNTNVVNVGIIGPGSYATNTLLPIISALNDKYRLHTVVNRSGKKAFDVATRFKAIKASSDINDILNNREIHLVIITTRHGNHAELVLKCLQHGKHVFVEKPLAISKLQLDQIKAFYEIDVNTPRPLLMVGFNRRFSSYIQEVKKHVSKRINPMFIRYRMNAGYSPANLWVHEDGGRIIGEACHLIDLVLFLTDSVISEITVSGITPTNNAIFSSDNKSFTLKFVDGSIAVIDYFAIGNKALPKELLEVHFDGKSIIVNDYKSVEGFGIRVANISSKTSKKGQYEEMIALHNGLITGTMPISLNDLFQTTEATFIIADQ